MTDQDILKATLAVTPHCLKPEQLEALLDGRQSNPHLASCPRCQAELALLKTFESGSPLPDEGAAVAWISSHLDRQMDAIKSPVGAKIARSGVQSFEQQGPWLARIFGRSAWRWAVPAAGLAVAAIMVAMFLDRGKEPDLQAHLGTGQVVYRSQEVQVIGPVGDVQQVPEALAWQAFPGAIAYRVQVMEIDKTGLWSAETKEISAQLPTSLRAKMLPGKPILWQVTALDATGRVLGTSQIQRFATPREHSSGTAQ